MACTVCIVLDIIQQCRQQVEFCFRPEISSFFFARGIIDDSRCNNRYKTFIVVGFPYAVPMVRVLHIKQIEYANLITHIFKITGGAFIQFGFRVGQYHAFFPLDTLKNEWSDKAPAFTRARRTDCQYCEKRLSSNGSSRCLP